MITEVFTYMLSWLTVLFNMLLSKGGIIGIAIIVWPIFIRIVRVLRSIIKR